jgi:hypothetical protein
MKRKIVCLYSGGFKSRACLFELLNNKQYQEYIIQVHHVSIINHATQFQSSSQAIKDTLKIIQKAAGKKFTVSENQINFSCLPPQSSLPDDIDICAFVASQMVNNDQSIRYIAMGFSNENFVQTDILNRIQAALDLTKLNPDAALDAEYIFPLMNKTRAEAIALVPKII